MQVAPAHAYLVGNELPLTQEFLAQMMGVTRSSVTTVAREMQKAGMIAYSRGRVRITDLEQIQARACECEPTFNRITGAFFTRTKLDNR